MRSSSPVASSKQPADPAVWLRDLLAIGLLAAFAALFLLPPLWTPGIVNQGDFLMSVYRIAELDEAWRSGVYYPRMGPTFNFGYGAPLFQYYPPFASYVGMLISWLGPGNIASAKAVLSLSLVLGAAGVYVYGKYLLRNRFAALIGALVYMVSPYLLMVIYERGAVSEMTAWGILPWLFYAAHRFSVTGQRRDGLLTAAAVALLMLTHNATALFLIPGSALFVSLLALAERRPRSLLRVAGVFVLGAASSSFYWLPAMAEMSFSKASEMMFNEFTSVAYNVVPVGNLTQHTWFAHYTGLERFHFALWQAVAAAVSIVVLFVRRRQRPVALWLLAGAWVVVLALQTTWSLPFWENVPFVRFIQFPWRLHGLGSFATALLIGAVAMDADLRAPAQRVLWPAGAAVLLALVTWLGTTYMTPAHSLLWKNLSEEEISRAALWERGLTGYPLWTDYTLATVPIGSTGYTQPRALDDPTRLAPTTTPQIVVRSDNPVHTVLDVYAAEPWTLRLHRAFLPGWRVLVDGKAVPTTAAGGGGIVSAELPAGEYRVTARLGDTPLRGIVTVVSIVACALWLVWAVGARPRWVAVASTAALAVAMALAIRLVTVEAQPGITPTAYRATFDNGITLLGWNVAENPVCIGRETPFRTWWHAARTPDADYKFFTHIILPDDSAKVAQFDRFPSDGYNPMTRWEAGELVPNTQTLLLEEGAPPGRYLLVLGVYEPVAMLNARVLDAPTVLPGDRLVLGEIEVADCGE